jgi:anti-anti-sigma regulatory factor
MRLSRNRDLVVVAHHEEPESSGTERPSPDVAGGRRVAVVPLRGSSLPQVLGDLDRRLGEAFEGGPRTLVIDMTGVGRVSSTTIAALLWTKRRCSSRGVEVQLRGPSRRCLDALGRVGLLGVFAVEPTDGPGRLRGRITLTRRSW